MKKEQKRNRVLNIYTLMFLSVKQNFNIVFSFEGGLGENYMILVFCLTLNFCSCS
jgi:hypothetical protein